MDKPGVLLVAAMDTKGQEALYVKACLEEAGTEVFVIDAGIMGESPCPVTVTRQEVAWAAGKTLEEVRDIGHEGKALDIMIEGAIRCARDLFKSGKVQGVIGLGGSMGTTLGTAVMRILPLGVPKVMVSTMASRNTRPFVRTRDILMLHAVCDLSGLNRVTRKVLRNGALAVAGMVKGRGVEEGSPEGRLAVVSTLGTTEHCAVRIREGLTSRGFEPVIFHTVGSGGEALEEMVGEEKVEAVLDLSLHEMADHLFGGDYDAGPHRGKAALQKGVPTVLAPGNIDFLVTGPLHEAARRYPGRPYHIHNAAITVVRTKPGEIATLAGAIAGLCENAGGPCALLVPLKGFSAFDREGGPLHDPDGPSLFLKRFRKAFGGGMPVKTVPCHINDPGFAEEALRTMDELVGRSR